MAQLKQKAFDVMHRAYWHEFQVLTKRSERLLDLCKHLDWKENIWMGVSVESKRYAKRIDYLRKTHASSKFLSIEPLPGPLPNLDLSGIDWVIVGGESGPGSRPMLLDWVIDIRDQCLSADIPFFFKQWGGVNKKKAGRSLEGRTWDEIAKELPCLKNKSFGETVTIEPFSKRGPDSEGQKLLRT